MTWPSTDAATTDLDAGTDNPASARDDILAALQMVNQIRAHVSAFMQGVLAAADAAGLRGALGISNHEKIAVDSSGNASSTGGLSLAGNLSVGGNATIAGNWTAYSDERIKRAWKELPPQFVQLLAEVRVGTYELKGHGGTRHAGVSAQALREVLPEAVFEDEGGVLSVAYDKAALAACVMLAREVMALRAEIQRRPKGRA